MTVCIQNILKFTKQFAPQMFLGNKCLASHHSVFGSMVKSLSFRALRPATAINNEQPEGFSTMLNNSAYSFKTMPVNSSRPFSVITHNSTMSKTEGFFKRMVNKSGLLEHSKSKLKRSGFVLYEEITSQVSVKEFFKVCEMPDTFFSWFLVIELHVWILMVRLMAEKEDGRFVRNALVEAMWEDVEYRSKQLNAASNVRKDQIDLMAGQFQAALFSYDEGLLSEDHVLASALWRRLFSQTCEEPERLECCILYIRKQVLIMDGLSRNELLLDCKVNWTPLVEKDSTKSSRLLRNVT